MPMQLPRDSEEGSSEHLRSCRCLIEQFHLLCDRFGYPPPAARPASGAATWPPPALPVAEQETLVLEIRRSLSRIAAAGPADDAAVLALLDGAQLSARTEILTSQSGWLFDLLSGFAYLLTLYVSGEEDALRITDDLRALPDSLHPVPA
jgi:hypothetical protein